jgi:transaldolase
MLWASTSVKNPVYPELLYVESLIGDETINTLPPETLETFMALGNIQSVLEDNMEISLAKSQLKQLEELGVNLKQICDQLLQEGIASFARSYDQLHSVLDEKCAKVAEDYAGT